MIDDDAVGAWLRGQAARLAARERDHEQLLSGRVGGVAEVVEQAAILVDLGDRVDLPRARGQRADQRAGAVV